MNIFKRIDDLVFIKNKNRAVIAAMIVVACLTYIYLFSPIALAAETALRVIAIAAAILTLFYGWQAMKAAQEYTEISQNQQLLIDLEATK